MSEQRIIVERLHEAYNERRFDVYAELLDEDAVLFMNGGSVRGRARFCDYVIASVRELPGVRVRIERVLADSGDTLVVETRYVDSSPQPVPGRTVPGAWRLPFGVCEAYRIADGRITECRNYLGAELAEQLSDGAVAPWPGITQLVAEQAALRRVATLVARGATQPEVFAAVVSEAGELLGENVVLLRFDGDDATTVVAQHSADDFPDLTGQTTQRGDAPPRSVEAGRPVRVDSYAGLPGPGAEVSRQLGVVASATTPVVLQGEPWGGLAVFSRVGLAVGIEDRLAQFADLAATAIGNAQSQAELQLLADEQAALRRVAELVARGAATREVFDRVASEASRLLDDAPTTLARYERSGTEVVIEAQCLADSGTDNERYVMGTRIPVRGEIARARVWRTGQAVRIDDYASVAGVETIRSGLRAAVSAPITVEGRVWGVLSAGSLGPPLPIGTEARLTRFCELVAAAIANADSRAQLTASRARIVASGDEARRRLARDVHDGAQQRLVHAIIMLKQARAALEGTVGPAAALVGESLDQAQAANEQLRDLAHGIMPGALARGGLHAAVESLRAHVPLTLDAEVLVDRLPERAELTAYFVISEALTNVVKHAGARRARVRAVLDADRLQVEISDDGHGGADPAAGSGLVGLADRVDAAGGTMSLTSPPDVGTTLSIELPINLPRSPEPDARGLTATHRCSAVPTPAAPPECQHGPDGSTGACGRRR